MTMTCTTLKDAALELGRLGYAVFPCRPGEKIPITKRGFKDATSDLAQIESWWTKYPDANIAVATRGMVVVDVDDRTSEWYTRHRLELEAACGAMSVTPRGGTHFFMREPEDSPCRCSAGKLAPGIDVRADGGYVVVPCSVAGDKAYSWVGEMSLRVEPQNLPDAPAWLMEQVAAAAKPSPRPPSSPTTSPDSPSADDKMIPEGRRDSTLASIAGTMRRRGLSTEEIAAGLRAVNARRCQPPLGESEVAAIAASIGRYDAKPMVGAQLILLDTDEHRVVDDAVKALASDPDVYCRGNILVRVVEVAADPGTPPTQSIVRLEPPTLRERLTLHGEIMKYNKDGDQVPAHPTGWLVSALEARGFWPGIRPLAGVADAPLLRRDGSICAVSGYDAATGVVVTIPEGFPAAPTDPTLEDARAAVEELVQVVCDFRFESPEHRSAWLAAIITTIARFAFDGPSPMFLVDANVRGAGKGLLCQVISLISLGRITPVSSAPSDTDETRKQITTAAMGADRIVLLDNVEGKLGNDALDRALTCTRWRDRILGKSEQVDLPLIPTWLATGNNVTVGADTARRIIHVRLDVLEEKPEERRDFQHPNLLAWVIKERPRLYVAALTIVAAYMRAGKPVQAIDPFGSFEGWSDLVRGSLVWAGLPDPCLGRKRLVESADSARESLSAILDAFRQMDPANDGIVIAPLLLDLYGADKGLNALTDAAVAMRTALESLPGVGGGSKAPTGRAVGNALRKFRRRVVDGVYLDTDPERSTASGKVWRLFDADTGQPAAPKAPPV
ncbi:MAG TPA: bifunctional DNA primase/polymerase [Phycisphaerales bacterium]|nr:bifunctional DNA primase/polymerase [Phycisphaerales bacterium]